MLRSNNQDLTSHLMRYSLIIPLFFVVSATAGVSMNDITLCSVSGNICSEIALPADTYAALSTPSSSSWVDSFSKCSCTDLDVTHHSAVNSTSINLAVSTTPVSGGQLKGRAPRNTGKKGGAGRKKGNKCNRPGRNKRCEQSEIDDITVSFVFLGREEDKDKKIPAKHQKKWMCLEGKVDATKALAFEQLNGYGGFERSGCSTRQIEDNLNIDWNKLTLEGSLSQQNGGEGAFAGRACPSSTEASCGGGCAPDEFDLGYVGDALEAAELFEANQGGSTKMEE